MYQQFYFVSGKFEKKHCNPLLRNSVVRLQIRNKHDFVGVCVSGVSLAYPELRDPSPNFGKYHHDTFKVGPDNSVVNGVVVKIPLFL